MFSKLDDNVRSQGVLYLEDRRAAAASPVREAFRDGRWQFRISTPSFLHWE